MKVSNGYTNDHFFAALKCKAESNASDTYGAIVWDTFTIARVPNVITMSHRNMRTLAYMR